MKKRNKENGLVALVNRKYFIEGNNHLMARYCDSQSDNVQNQFEKKS